MKTLLFIGMAAPVVFLVVLLIDGALQPGYDPVYHTGSELMLGKRGWLRRSSFPLMAVGMVGVAVGVQRTLDAPAGTTLFAVAGVA